VNGLSQLLQNLGTVRLAILGSVAIGLIALIMFMATRIGSSNFELLYGNLEPEDSGAVISKLDASNIPYKLNNNGRDILVPSDQVAKLRLNMAQEGIPNGGSVGYEIFDNTDTFGTTAFVQNVNLVRALEGELARTIRALNSVTSARVHLVLPKRQVFSREKRNASASIIVKLKGRLQDEQISAIQYLVAAAVPTLAINRISIVDSKGNLLARGDGKDNSGQGFGSRTEFMRATYENRIREQIEALLENSLGKGNVRAQISAVMDFDQKTVKSEAFDPDGQVVRSTQTVEENNSSNDGAGNAEGVTVANNLPEAQAVAATLGAQSAANRLEETVNYEISKTVTTEIREAGLVQRLTVAVLVNGRAIVDADGKTTYEPLDDTALEQISRLVKSAIGFNQERGDVVEIVNMPFVQIATPEFEQDPTEEAIFMGFTKPDLFRMGEMGVLAIVAILALLLVVRPLLNRALSADATGNALAIPGGGSMGAITGIPGGATAALPGGGGVDASGGGLEGPGGGDPSLQSETLTELDEMIDIAKVEGQVKTSALKKVGEIVEKHPDEAVAILRNWLYHEK